MVADNDAGGITTYTATGAKYGLHLLWFLILLGPVAYYVQEMTVRLGAVTKRGHAEAIFAAFGRFWGWFSLLDLVLTDWLTMITEFIGMTAALSIFGVAPWVTVLICCVMMGGMILSGRYWTWEKIALFFCIGNLIYIPAAFVVQPTVGELFKNTVPHLPPGGFTNELFFLLMANIGTTIAPWMLFFQQSSVVDKGLKEKDIRFAKLDTAIGAVLTVVVAAVLIIVCGKLLNGQQVEDAAAAAKSIMPQSRFIGTVIAIGLFDAGFLGAICISLASSWAFGEVFGWAHSLNHKVKEAPWFYAYYFFTLAMAGTVVLIPGAPLVLITLFVQVIATTLLPAALVFLILLLNDKKTMGKFVNSRWENFANISIVVAIIVLSTMYGISALFPTLLANPAGAWQDTLGYFRNFAWTPGHVVIGGVLLGGVIAYAGARVLGRKIGMGMLLLPFRGARAVLHDTFIERLWHAAAARFLHTRPGRFFRLTRNQVREINKKYATPEIETTPFANTCLIGLRVYLIALVALLIFKFSATAISGGDPTRIKDQMPEPQSQIRAQIAPGVQFGRPPEGSVEELA
jgi:Mn2+/Fe2+ NRAMP family transporter